MRYVSCILLSLFGFLLSSPLQAKCSKRADYVIVGVGTSGAVLANLLSGDKKTSVIALHLGENLTEDPEIKFSRFAVTTVVSSLLGPPFFENGLTIPQTNADNRQLPWVIAKPEGGASSVNVGAYCRGTNELYSQWEAIAGPLWSVNRILDIFRVLESYQGETTNPAARGFFGPVAVRQIPTPTQVSKTFAKATIQGTGFPFVLDYNDPLTPIGVSPQFQYTQKGPNGELRVSSATAFLNESVMTPEGHGVDGRKLRVFFESRALRTIWDGKKAIGVEYLQNGKTKRVYANKGVIVSAGLYSSPFLMHSGVGPASLLNSLGIPVVFDNPNVGQGLADQTQLLTLWASDPDDFPTHEINSPFDYISWLPAPGGDPKKREIRFSTTTKVPGITIGLVDLVQPKSRGSITINSSDPLAPPVVDLGVLSDPNDLALYQSALQVYIKSINQAFTNPMYQLVLPDPSILDDLALLTDYIRENVGCNESFQSHCRMAPQAQGGVVDSTGHVYGVRNLIVADDSIVPLCMDGATMASAYLIGMNVALILLGVQ